jgi:hypothetical protein
MKKGGKQRMVKKDVRMDADLARFLEQRSKQTGMSQSEIARRALDEVFEEEDRAKRRAKAERELRARASKLL